MGSSSSTGRSSVPVSSGSSSQPSPALAGDTEALRVLVFGSVGQGKSSVVNTLSQKYIAPAGDNAQGVTFESSAYEARGPDNQQFYLLDTAGLNEAAFGRVSHLEAFRQLKSLLVSAQNHGYCLAMMVHKCNNFQKESFRKNYDLFVTVLFKHYKVPVLLVVTGLDDDDDFYNCEWYESNNAHIKYTYPEFVGVCGGCAAWNRTNKMLDVTYEDFRAALHTTLWEQINRHRLTENAKIGRQGFVKVLTNTWNGFISKLAWGAQSVARLFAPAAAADAVGAGIRQFAAVEQHLIQFMQELGMTEDEARIEAIEIMRQEA